MRQLLEPIDGKTLTQDAGDYMSPSRLACLGVICSLLPVAISYRTFAAQGIGDEIPRAAALEAGRTTFRQFCSPCHGLSGGEPGPVGRLLRTPPADVTRIKSRNGGQFPLKRIEEMLTTGIRMETEAHGSDQMPIWGPVFRGIDTSESLVKARIANLVAYLESLQK